MHYAMTSGMYGRHLGELRHHCCCKLRLRGRRLGAATKNAQVPTDICSERSAARRGNRCSEIARPKLENRISVFRLRSAIRPRIVDFKEKLMAILYLTDHAVYTTPAVALQRHK